MARQKRFYNLEEIAQRPGHPSKQTLHNIKNERAVPWIVTRGGVLCVDVNHPEWAEWLVGYQEKTGYQGPDAASEIQDLAAQAKRAKLYEPILKAEKLRYENERRKLDLEREAGGLIEYQLAEWLFFGYIERINVELLSITKKLAPIIDNLVAEKKPNAILKAFDKEFGVILTEVRQAQKKDLEKWRRGDE